MLHLAGINNDQPCNKVLAWFLYSPILWLSLETITSPNRDCYEPDVILPRNIGEADRLHEPTYSTKLPSLTNYPYLSCVPAEILNIGIYLVCHFQSIFLHVNKLRSCLLMSNRDFCNLDIEYKGNCLRNYKQCELF